LKGQSRLGTALFGKYIFLFWKANVNHVCEKVNENMLADFRANLNPDSQPKVKTGTWVFMSMKTVLTISLLEKNPIPLLT
jgi:hypothetical protein